MNKIICFFLRYVILATDEQIRTYGDVSRKEDVLGLVEILTAKENWFLNNLGQTEAKDMVHITLTDSLRTAASAAVGEGGDYTMGARTTPSRIQNIVQIVAIPYAVTRSQQQIQKYTGENELNRQTTKALMEWGSAAEFDLVRSTITSGVSGTTPKLSGILEAISRAETYSAQTSGTAFSATILAAMMKDSWDDGNGDVATDLFLGSYLRDIMDTFTTKNLTTVYSALSPDQVKFATSTYETSFGMVNVHTHRYLRQSGDATGRALLLRPDKLKIAYLQKPFIDTGLARSGDYDKRAIVGKLTLEVRNQLGHVYQNGFNIG